MISTILNKCRDKKVYIYGDGEDGRLTRIFLHEQGVSVSAFVVTDKPVRVELMKLPVISLKAFSANKEDALFFICMHKKWWNEVVEVLNQKGYRDSIIVDDAVRKGILNSIRFDEIYEDVERGRYINILLYHRVESLKTVSSLIVNEQNFEDQLRYIKTNYDVLRADESWAGVNKKSVVLTFDDGYVDFYYKVYPLLKKYRIPATVFVTTGNIDTEREFWWDRLEWFVYNSSAPSSFCIFGRNYNLNDYENKEKLLDEMHDQMIEMHFSDREKALDDLVNHYIDKSASRARYRTMNSEEIRLLSKDPLITIGAHTISHILCDHEDADCQRKEIEESKIKLENLTGREVDLFAYPNGNVGIETRSILDELGFYRAFTCVKGCVRSDEKKFDIPRCPVLNWPSDENEKWFRGMWQTGKDV